MIPKSDVAIIKSEIEIGIVDNVGLVHNEIISEIYDEKGLAMYSLSRTDQEHLVLDKLCDRYGSIPVNIILQKAQINAQIEEMLDAIDNVNDSIDETFDKILAICPERQNELEIVKIYCEKLSQLPDDVGDGEDDLRSVYSGQITDVINNSSIPDDLKDVILCGINIGQYSNMMWEESDTSVIPN